MPLDDDDLDAARVKRELLVMATARQAMEKLSPDHVVQYGPNAFWVEWKDDDIFVLVTAESRMRQELHGETPND